VHDNGGVSKVVETEDTSKTLQDYIVKKRLYGRFRKAKDTCGYSENDMAAILGKKSEPTTPKPDQLGYTRAVTTVAAVEKKEGDDGSGVTTVTSKLSIRDYFSKMMSAGGSRYSAAGGAGFTEEFQEAHYNQLHKVADAYTGKMGLGAGRSSDPWETDNYRASFSSPTPTPTPSFSTVTTTATTTTTTTTMTSVTEEKTKKAKKEEPPPKPVEVVAEKPKKNKKKRELSPNKVVIDTQPITKQKKSSKDISSSSSATATPAPSSSSSSIAASTTSSSESRKSKKSKDENALPAEPTPVPETEKPKKNKKAKTVVSEAEAKQQEVKKLKKEKKSKAEEESDLKTCSFCCSLDVPMTCGGCQKAFYCGVACQTSHWATHKLKCKLQC